jgi:hypothetical protein
VTGCKPEEQPNNGGTTGGGETPSVSDTSFDLVKDGKSDYKILISSEATDTEKYASGELVSFFKQATGVTLPIVMDTGDMDENNKYISIGDTSLFEESGMKVSLSELGADGFKIKTYGNSVILNAAEEGGKLYSVYDFMEEQIGFEVYAANEIYVDTIKDRKLKDFDVTEVPDFEGRDVHDVVYGNNATFASRKRLRGVITSFSSAQGNGSVWSRTLWCHSTHILLRPSLHLSAHRDWFSVNEKDICYGTGIEDSPNGELMRQTMFESLKYYIEIAPKAKYFMIGLEDDSGYCGCSKCMTANKLYSGHNNRMSGTMVVFVNKMARMVKAWLQDTYPERADQVVIGMFAYQNSLQPPVEKNYATGEYTYHKDVVPDSNVMIRFAPISAVYSKPMTDPVANKETEEIMKGWRALGANMSVWSYSCPFGAYLYPAYNWHNMQDNYRIFLEYGVTDVLDQGPRDSAILPFQAMRDYVQAELLWDVDQDINVLIDSFMENYYKDAAPYVKQYFNLINANYALMEKTKGYSWKPGPWESRDQALAEYYPKAYLNSCLDLLAQAKKAAEKIENESTRRAVMERLEKEELSPRYIVIEQYKEYYDDATLRAMFTNFQSDANRLGLSYYAESHLISTRYNNWWLSVN